MGSESGPTIIKLDFRVANDFHVYGFEWDPNYVKMYVDGRLVNCATKQELGDKWVASNEQKIWIDSETFDWEVKPVNLKASDFAGGQKFIVDYCRVWQRTRASIGCDTQANLLANPGFEDALKSWTGSATLSQNAHLGKGAAVLETGGSLTQTVMVKPKTTYVLSAWAASPETNQADLWFNAYLGVKGYGGAEANTRFFFPYYHQKSIQFTTGPASTTAVIYFTNMPQGRRATIDDIRLVEVTSPDRFTIA